MRFARASGTLAFAHPLQDMAPRDRAVRADPVGRRLAHHAEYRTPDLHRVGVILGLHAPGAIVPGAALDRGQLRAGDRLQHFARFLPHVLHARMAGDVIRDLAQCSLEIRLQQAVAVAQHEILERVEHRLLHRLDVGVVGEHQRQLLLEHQGAGGHRGEDRVALARKLGERRDVDVLVPGDRLEIAEFEFRHSATGLLFEHDVGDRVVLENREQVVADARLVVVDVAGGVNRDLARCVIAVLDFLCLRGGGVRQELAARVVRQLAFLRNAEHALHHATCERHLVHRIDRLHHDRDRRGIAHPRS